MPKKSESTKGNLGPKLAEELLKADVANIAKKVEAGKTLTRAERALLESATNPGVTVSQQDTAKSLTDLATILGVTRQVLYKWKKMEGAPKVGSNGVYDVLAWRDFMRERGLSSNKPKEGEGKEEKEGEESETELKRKKLALDVADKEFSLAIKRGEYVALGDVQAKWGTEVGRAIQLLRNKLENELPPILSGLDAIAIQKELAKVIDEYASMLHEGKS